MAISLTSYKPGESGNLNGRPKKGYSITEIFQEMFTEDPNIKKQLAKKIINKALDGDMVACKLIWGYMDGLPHQNTSITAYIPPIPIMGGSSNLENL